MRAAFARAWAGNRIYEVCHFAEAFGRFPSAGPFPELDLIFSEAWYSRARKRAAASLALADPAFPTGRAVECLWDCEHDTRQVGIEHVEARLADATTRIAELAADEFEHDDVRKAARLR